MSALAGIGKTGRIRLSKVLKSNPGVITSVIVANTLDLSLKEASRTLSRWCANGWLHRIKRGVYIPVPIDSTSSDVIPEEPFVIAESLYHPGYIGGFSAIKHWDLSEQVIETIYYFSTRQVRDRNPTYGSLKFKIKTIRESRIFGTKPIWYGSKKIQVSDPTKTIVDVLDDPKLVGGMSIVSDLFCEYVESEHRDFKMLLDYADRMNNKTILKRVGLLSEVRLDDMPKEFTHIRERISSGYSSFDPTIDAKTIIEKWKLRVPGSWKREFDRKK